MTGVLIREVVRNRHIQREEDVKTRGEDSHQQAKEQELEMVFPSQPSGGMSPEDTFISDF